MKNTRDQKRAIFVSRRALGLLLCSVLAGCAGSPGSAGRATGASPLNPALYRCASAVEFSVRFIDDTAVLDGTRGHDLLYRDAGGQGALQSVYSNPRLRAEFGLGATGREAILRYSLLPLVLRCLRD